MEVVATHALRFSEARATCIIPFIIMSNILIVLTTEPDYIYICRTNTKFKKIERSASDSVVIQSYHHPTIFSDNVLLLLGLRDS